MLSAARIVSFITRNAIETEEAYKLFRDKSLQIYAESCTHFNASPGSLIAGSHANDEIRESFPLALTQQSSGKFSIPFHPFHLDLDTGSSEHDVLKEAAKKHRVTKRRKYFEKRIFQ